MDNRGNNPVVSVIIPTFRRWDLLCDAIESVFAQTYEDWEIVVVNDAGGKPEGRAVELLADPRVQYLEHETNMGRSAARNTGIAHASGEFIAYLDDDDLFYPNHLNLLVSKLADSGKDVVYSLAREGVYETLGSAESILRRDVKFNRGFELRLLWRENIIPMISVIHRRKCLEKTGGFDPRLTLLEDWDLWLRMSIYFEFNLVKEVTSEFRVTPEKTDISDAASYDKWWNAKIFIFNKYLNDPIVNSNKQVFDLLVRGISHFILKHYRWVIDNAGNGQDNILPRLMMQFRYYDMFRLMLRDWQGFAALIHLMSDSKRSDRGACRK